MTDNAFNEWEHLQSVTRFTFSRLVREAFREDAPDDITTPEGALRHAMLPKDNDTSAMTNLRILLYLLYRGEIKTPSVYGIPIADYESEIRYKPQIKLHFMQDFNQAEAGYTPVRGETAIRLIGETSNTISQADLLTYAQRIRTTFAQPVYVWRKGKIKYTYKDDEKGYSFSILSISEAEAKEYISKLLDIVNESPDWQWFTPHPPENPNAKYPPNPGTQTILGQVVRKPRRRPVADVKFKYADLHIHGMPNPITLYDTTGLRRNPILN